MSIMQAYSCANATILHSQHHLQARLNRGYVGLSPPKAFSTAGYCCRTKLWPFWSQLWHPGLCSNSFITITFAIGKGKSFKAGGRKHQENRKNSLQKKDKGNVWSLDDEYTVSDANKDLGKKRKGRRVSKSGRSKGPPLRILVSAAMPVETEKVLQTQDGSYSRGPLKLPVGRNLDNSNYFISPTYKIEQCLVRGSHKRLRAVHTIAVKGGGAEVQLMRLALYEEEWMGPIHSKYMGETEESSLKPFSQRKRIPPAVLAGAWKVFEISATAILEEDIGEAAAEKRPSYVYLCMEMVKRRSLPEVPVHFVDEDALDMQDATVLWLPDGVTAYVDTKEDGILSIGVGWYSDDGTNLVMERDYGADGKLLEVRSKSEIKRRWSVD